MKKRLSVVSCILAAFFLSFAGCGIEYIVALDKPESIGTSYTDRTFKVYVEIQDYVSEFRGLELYYRFTDGDVSPESVHDSRDGLVIDGFTRIMSAAVDSPSFSSKPLAAVPIGRRDHRIEVTIDFSDPTSAFLTAYDATASEDLPGYTDLEVRRSAIIGDTFKDFGDLDSADSDLQGLDPEDITNRNLYLVIYALSYGKQDIVIDAYSKPAYLEYIDPFV